MKNFESMTKRGRSLHIRYVWLAWLRIKQLTILQNKSLDIFVRKTKIFFFQSSTYQPLLNFLSECNLRSNVSVQLLRKLKFYSRVHEAMFLCTTPNTLFTILQSLQCSLFPIPKWTSYQTVVIILTWRFHSMTWFL